MRFTCARSSVEVISWVLWRVEDLWSFGRGVEDDVSRDFFIFLFLYFIIHRVQIMEAELTKPYPVHRPPSALAFPEKLKISGGP